MQEGRGGWRRRTPAGPPPEPPAELPAAPTTEHPAVTTIEAGWEIDGDLRVAGPLLVLGDFRGSIRCQDLVTVSEGGSVQGPIHARRVQIHGGVVGDVVATRDLVLHASGKLHGDVETPSLVVERGAFFSGCSRMVRSPVVRAPLKPNEAGAEAAAESLPQPQPRPATV